jgi:pyridoxine 4-dehydrogenase
LSGSVTPGKGDFRAAAPRFQGENLTRNLALAEALGRIAEARGVTSTQLAIAWALHRGDDIIPLSGARKRTQLNEALAAAEIALTPAELAEIEAAVPADAVAGERYGAMQMAHLDSERSGSRH